MWYSLNSYAFLPQLPPLVCLYDHLGQIGEMIGLLKPKAV